MISVEHVTDFCRQFSFMGGIARDDARITKTAEVFTPLSLVNDMLDTLPPDVFVDETKTFIDNSCGDGQFLSEILIRKVSNGIDFEVALSSLYGVDLMPDNVERCRERLLCGQEHLRHIVEKNIVCHDAMTYDYSFK